MNGNKSSFNTWDNLGKGKESIDSTEQTTSRGSEGRSLKGDDASSNSSGSRRDYSKEIAETLKGK